MMTNSQVKRHYDTHLQDFYSWMAGDFEKRVEEQKTFLENYRIYPQGGKIALDLGVGHGVQSVALARLGFEVTAIDFNQKLLGELNENKGETIVNLKEDDIVNVKKYASLYPELIGCWGDTLAHLASDRVLETFIGDIAACLSTGGRFLASFRDYSQEKSGSQHIIPVKSDQQRILTCILNYEPQKVKVTDLLWENDGVQWQQKASTYYKIRISPGLVVRLLNNHGFEVQLNTLVKGEYHLIARKIN